MPAIRFSSVDLPDPDGPNKQTKPPASIARLVSRSATTSFASLLNTRLTPRTSTAVTPPTPLLLCLNAVSRLQLLQRLADDDGFPAPQACRHEYLRSHLS